MYHYSQDKKQHDQHGYKNQNCHGLRLLRKSITASFPEHHSAYSYPAFIASARLLSYVCVPTLYQKVVGECVDLTSDLSIYQKNKDLFYNALVDMGYECVEPGGAFYLFPKALEEDANAFCEKAKEYDLLIVPGDSFGCPGYVRISYCVPTERIEKALPLFKKLIDDYRK